MKKRKKHSAHSERAILFGIAVLLLSYSFIFSESRVVARTATSMLGSASSVMVGVEPNPDNTIAAQLKAKEAELTEREAGLIARERALTMQDILPIASLVASVVLLVLISMNFYLDVRRGRTPVSQKTLTVNLKQ